MALIKSISGIRGTIGGAPGEGLSPVDVVRFTSAYGTWLKENSSSAMPTVVVGRDARISGEMVKNLVLGSLQGLGINVINLGMATTPTTELAVVEFAADGGLILTASHNPKEWNALKLLNSEGEFLDAEEGAKVLKIADEESFYYSEVEELGRVKEEGDFLRKHIEKIVDLDLVDVDAIKSAGLKVVVDGVNSVGGIALPELLKAIGVKEVVELYCNADGRFPHNPEPLPEHLTAISELIKQKGADLGFVVDPDVDRLAIVNEDGTMFGEEYTLVSVADYVLTNTLGNTVSNLSSSRALKDITEKHGQKYSASAVGEVNVVKKMKETNAVIGGEGNGGVIYPASHCGRDALVGAALFLSHLAKSGLTCSQLRDKYPSYFMIKEKIELTPDIDIDNLLVKIREYYKEEKINDIDGVRIDFDNCWVHLRKSNTEPIIRIYSEAPDNKRALALVDDIKNVISKIG
ncbi:phosphoglucosamine mutase [Marinilabiliaceae bacterium ANBcel2]|nr:phosphoglucosamine mutase [Marinilabiliaceae bacterium ANBcel2]